MQGYAPGQDAAFTQSRYYSPGLLHGVLLSAVCGLRGVGGCFEAGVVMVPAGACLVAASPS